MSTPRIILWDIETSHNLVAAFNLWERHGMSLPHDNIIRERYIISAAWKLLGEKHVHAVSVLDDRRRYDKSPHDDNHVVRRLHQVLSTADVIVAHHGDAYDSKFFAARALFHNLPKLPPIKSVDTRKIAKKHFLFNSNRLDYLGQHLGLGKKLETEKGLWLRVLRGEASAVRQMVTYNKGDVELLEKVFLKLRPYVEDAINRHLYGLHSGCPRCGSIRVQSRGTRKAITRTYRQFQCQDCGGWFRDSHIESKTTTRLLA